MEAAQGERIPVPAAPGPLPPSRDKGIAELLHFETLPSVVEEREKKWLRDLGGLEESGAAMKKVTRQELYHRAYDLALELFRAVSYDAEAPEFELSVEIRKAAQEMVCNLSPDLDAKGVLDAASNSAARLEYTLLLARDLKMFGPADLEDLRKRAAEIRADVRKLKSRR